jgi:hypothetical protein
MKSQEEVLSNILVLKKRAQKKAGISIGGIPAFRFGS